MIYVGSAGPGSANGDPGKLVWPNAGSVSWAGLPQSAVHGEPSRNRSFEPDSKRAACP